MNRLCFPYYKGVREALQKAVEGEVVEPETGENEKSESR